MGAGKFSTLRWADAGGSGFQAVQGQIAGKGPDYIQGNTVRRANCQYIRHLGKGHNGIKLVIAVGAPSGDVQSEIDLGGGLLGVQFAVALATTLARATFVRVASSPVASISRSDSIR